MDFLKSFATFLVVDGIWLGIIAKNFYQKELALINDGPFEFNIIAAGLSYFLMTVGFEQFVMPMLRSKAELSLFDYLRYGGLFGLVLYGVFDLTNLAILKRWTLSFTVTDMLWGIVVYTIVSFIRTKIFV